MCGVFGVRYWDGRPIDAGAVNRARDTMVRRGPDDAHTLTAPGLALSHRRLAILDLSPAGRMPMSDERERVWAVFNGEIYNHRALRAQLESRGHRFRSQTDSEVLVHGYLEWGEDLFRRLEGMFAVGLWDTADRRLLLARDHAGEKPLYFAPLGDDGVAFASTIDALATWRGGGALSPREVAGYLSFGFARGTRTVLRDVHKVEPGTFLAFDAAGARRVERFWSLPAEHAHAPARRATAEDLHDVLLDAVQDRMEADVPLGAFLSGGVDSSLVCALMARARRDGVRTFTVGFDEPAFDESPHAQAVAAHLGIENVTRIISERDVVEEIDAAVTALDEPMADYSILPTLAVARLAREELTVALTGDGADELFGGYRYYSALAAFELWARAPRRLRRALSRLHPVLPEPRLRRILARTSASTAGEFFGSSGFYRGAVLQRSFGLLLPESTPNPAEIVAAEVASLESRTGVEGGMLWDATNTLPEAWLCKVDRASMNVSLETRAPFLAPAVQRLAVGLPLDDKVRIRERKVALRRVLRRYLPEHLVERPKQGFTPPMGRWMRTVLREELRALASGSRLAEAGLVRRAGLEQAVSEHVEGRFDHAQALWAVLLLERWTRQRGISGS
ncbi:MAG: asparagine synthase (glutamine-hydrolyzing) [Myxococcota bacterium]|nr:asparagine synthase (glutamine-hydrolyzing) [Myxococcota bacterium]